MGDPSPDAITNCAMPAPTNKANNRMRMIRVGRRTAAG
jgi:hypothetical protein